MIFNVTYPPAIPDSDLDSDLSLAVTYTYSDGSTIQIAPGDWVDVDESAIRGDVNWGYSFQVSNCYPDQIGILASTDDGETYSETVLSLDYIQNNFRRIPIE